MITRRAFLCVSLWIPPTLLLATACSGARPGVTAQLDPGPTAPLGGTMTFTLIASCIWDAPDPDSDGTKTTAAEVFFDMTVGLLSLDPQWSVTPIREGVTSYRRSVVFKANVPQSFEFTVLLDQEGAQWIAAGPLVALQTTTHSDHQTLYLSVAPTNTRIQRDPFTPTR